MPVNSPQPACHECDPNPGGARVQVVAPGQVFAIGLAKYVDQLWRGGLPCRDVASLLHQTSPLTVSLWQFAASDPKRHTPLSDAWCTAMVSEYAHLEEGARRAPAALAARYEHIIEGARAEGLLSGDGSRHLDLTWNANQEAAIARDRMALVFGVARTVSEQAAAWRAQARSWRSNDEAQLRAAITAGAHRFDDFVDDFDRATEMLGADFALRSALARDIEIERVMTFPVAPRPRLPMPILTVPLPTSARGGAGRAIGNGVERPATRIAFG